MGAWGIGHWLVVLLVIMLLFGAGRVSGLMGEVAKGIKSFKKGMAEDDESEMRRISAERAAQAVPPPAAPVQPAAAAEATPAPAPEADRREA